VAKAEASAFIEIPGGSRNKYEFDPELGGVALDRRLFTSMSYPAGRALQDDRREGPDDRAKALEIVAQARERAS
jgi:inorganic pyrophosphatase